MANTLGRLRRVELRAVWSSESSNFTPWLALEENLALLGETIGLDLELEAVERSVGAFRADIVCRDTAGGSWVLIENQIEPTDHGHLGQLLTYAAGLDAVTIVWIAERFRDEHRAALDWLNEVTSEDINLFGLEIELWQIGDSPIAPKFNVISQPNDWVKRIISAREDTGITATRQQQLEYWIAFREFLADKKSFLRPQKAQPQNWLVFSLGRSGFHYSAIANSRNKSVAAELAIDSPHAKAFFRELERDRTTIEAELGESLTWQELPNRKMSRVLLVNRHADFSNRDDWHVQFAWLQNKLEKFHQVFTHRIRALSITDATSLDMSDSEEA